MYDVTHDMKLKINESLSMINHEIRLIISYHLRGDYMKKYNFKRFESAFLPYIEPKSKRTDIDAIALQYWRNFSRIILGKN